MESTQDNMLFASFNQDATCFAVGTEKGFKIFNSFPFKDSFERSKIKLHKINLYKTFVKKIFNKKIKNKIWKEESE